MLVRHKWDTILLRTTTWNSPDDMDIQSWLRHPGQCREEENQRHTCGRMNVCPSTVSYGRPMSALALAQALRADPPEFPTMMPVVRPVKRTARSLGKLLHEALDVAA